MRGVGWGRVAREFAVEGGDVDGDALGVAPGVVVAQRDVVGGVASDEAGVVRLRVWSGM